ncbi:Reticulon-domain-containing protein [Talaromyces proteolyticus]|uniref:Reticulon-like protein n=1 Tax=Talaromyces proteolyticus TaxID=1131652 RepID=A0AAD4KET2_9EURO|nr:Reticulon-domain-containing protein [Talaromyces proteolyticus]KAH8689412.1 Reticulon-domain-containing protein [Talaromyces proteolyticus]
MADSGDVQYPAVAKPSSTADNVTSEASKVTPSTTTSTGQQLTHYHSQLYSLLSWERPRATAISFASVVTFILAARYLPLLQWLLKFLYVTLGVTALAEGAGKLILNQGLASSFRPRKYYTLPKETVEGILEDLGQLFDFFLIEFQRILFAENVLHTAAAFVAAFLSWLLIMFLPLWGLSLIGVSVAYLGPLFYISNREIIDEQIAEVQKLINAQANQAKELANQQTARATGLVKQYATDYSSKAHEYIGNRRSASPETARAPAVKTEPVSPPKFQTSDFPVAPKTEPVAAAPETEAAKPAETKQEPLLAL